MLLILKLANPQENLVCFAHLGGKEHLEHSVTAVQNALHTDLHTNPHQRVEFLWAALETRPKTFHT
jgi:hypothetical protein